MEEPKAKPTIEDVARACGVSISTVSRVINQSSPVSDQLTLRVKKAIKDLGFMPRQWKELPVASKTIVITIPDVQSSYYAEIVNGAQEEAERQGVALLILDVSENTEYQEEHLNLLEKWGISGIIIAGTKLPADYLLELREHCQIPIVLSRAKEVPGFPCIIPDYTASTYRATQYLISLNHRRLAYISGPPDWVSSKMRQESIERALEESGLTLPMERVRWGYVNVEESAHATASLLQLPERERPTAIIAFDDVVAIGALRTIHTAGLRVPQDISVLGYNDIPLAAYTIPSLTTIAQPTYRIGQLAVKKLLELMSSGKQTNGGSIRLECPLILRESTGPCIETAG